MIRYIAMHEEGLNGDRPLRVNGTTDHCDSPVATFESRESAIEALVDEGYSRWSCSALPVETDGAQPDGANNPYDAIMGMLPKLSFVGSYEPTDEDRLRLMTVYAIMDLTDEIRKGRLGR
jgi:hypothetical protein